MTVLMGTTTQCSCRWHCSHTVGMAWGTVMGQLVSLAARYFVLTLAELFVLQALSRVRAQLTRGVWLRARVAPAVSSALPDGHLLESWPSCLSTRLIV